MYHVICPLANVILLFTYLGRERSLALLSAYLKLVTYLRDIDYSTFRDASFKIVGLELKENVTSHNRISTYKMHLEYWRIMKPLQKTFYSTFTPLIVDF